MEWNKGLDQWPPAARNVLGSWESPAFHGDCSVRLWTIFIAWYLLDTWDIKNWLVVCFYGLAYFSIYWECHHPNWLCSYWCVLRREFEAMIHTKSLVIYNNPSNPQQPIQPPYVQRTSKCWYVGHKIYVTSVAGLLNRICGDLFF